jgi:hypothetical protein
MMVFCISRKYPTRMARYASDTLEFYLRTVLDGLNMGCLVPTIPTGRSRPKGRINIRGGPTIFPPHPAAPPRRRFVSLHINRHQASNHRFTEFAQCDISDMARCWCVGPIFGRETQ